MPKAVRSFTVLDPETNEYHSHLAGDDVEDDVYELVSEEARPLIFEEQEDVFPLTDEGEMIATTGNSNAEADGNDPVPVQRKKGEEAAHQPPAQQDQAQYEDLTIPQLRALALERDVDLGDTRKKDDIIATLREDDETSSPREADAAQF